jgi:predicted TIM-barrel fold metal-dependent hydrolase
MLENHNQEVSAMRVIDADGHVEENLDTFSDKYLEPGFRSLRPRVTGIDGLAYWVIDEQLYPRRVGPGCHNLGTPTNYQGKVAAHSAGKPDSIESMELADLSARVKAMDEEDIAVQVIYTTLFLAYPLTRNVALASALCSSYNRWLGDRLAGQQRLKWSAVVNLDDIPRAVREVHEAKKLGAVSVMVLGTAGDDMLDHPRLFPFYEALVEENLALGVHVGWSCPAVNNLYSHIYPSGVIAFHIPLLMAFTALVSGGVMDRFPALRLVFLEAGCQWVPFIVERIHHRYKNQGSTLRKFLPQTAPIQKLPVMEYIKRGNIYFSTEVEDEILPNVLNLVGETQVIFGSDMPHGDRERCAARMLQGRNDISDTAKVNILDHNPARLYGIP